MPSLVPLSGRALYCVGTKLGARVLWGQARGPRVTQAVTRVAWGPVLWAHGQSLLTWPSPGTGEAQVGAHFPGWGGWLTGQHVPEGEELLRRLRSSSRVQSPGPRADPRVHPQDEVYLESFTVPVPSRHGGKQGKSGRDTAENSALEAGEGGGAGVG